MKILVSNDDGIQSPGLHSLADALAELGAQVTVVAPQIERSTTGHSLTLHKPLRIKEVSPNRFYVSGSPADCIYLGTRQIMKTKPDLVVSGINHGANLGQDHFYSGTVAAAREASFFGITSVAFSLCYTKGDDPLTLHWKTATEIAKNIIPKVYQDKFPNTHVLNINVPNLPLDQIKGLKFGVQGRRIYTDAVAEGTDPRGKNYYWIGGIQNGHDDIENSDCNLVADGFVAMVPLKSDSTDKELMSTYRAWEK